MKKFKKVLEKVQETYDIAATMFSGGANQPHGFSDYPRRNVMGDFGVHRIKEGDSLNRINAFIHKFLKGDYIDPEGAVRDLKVRLNHFGLDFEFSKKEELTPGENKFEVLVNGDVSGATPTTDLSKGFDKGEDLPKLTLTINVIFNETTGMYEMDGKLSSASVNENVEEVNEAKDPAKSVMHYIMRNDTVKDKVLKPVYNHLSQKEKKGKLSMDDMRKELYFVVNTALRKMNAGDSSKVTLSQKDKSRVVSDLVRNYKNHK
jgi:hypothetical protein